MVGSLDAARFCLRVAINAVSSQIFESFNIISSTFRVLTWCAFDKTSSVSRVLRDFSIPVSDMQGKAERDVGTSAWYCGPT